MTAATVIIEALACDSASCANCARSRRRGDGLVHCPAHDDPDPSLNVSERDGRVLVRCHGGCAQDTVVSALRDQGLWNGTAPEVRPRVVARYAYVSAGGELLYQIERLAPKGFRARRPDGRGGWIYNLDDVDRVMYRLPEVRSVVAASQREPDDPAWTVYIVEGEKDADALIALGLCATTNTGGASKWRDEYAEHVRGGRVVIIPDKDSAGSVHSKSVAASCRGRASSVKVLELPGDHVKDASDWISAGGTRAELEQLASEAPEWSGSSVPTIGTSVGTELNDPADRRREYNGNELVGAAEDAGDLDYLPFLGLSGYVVRRWSHLLAGYPRSGKTELLVRLVRAWLEIGLRVLFFTEESEDLWRTRLSRYGGDWSGLQVFFGLGVGADELRARARSGDHDVTILDAARNLLQLKDETDNSEIARKTNPWVVDARAAAKTLVMAHHDRKGGGEHGEGISGGHAFLGSFDIGLELLWTNSAQPRRRTIRSYSRIVTPAEFVYEMDDAGTVTVLGEPRAVAIEAVSERVLASLSGEWQTTKEIAESLGEPKPSQEQVRLALLALAVAKDAKVERDPPIATEPRRGTAHRWRPSSVPTTGTSVGGNPASLRDEAPTEVPTDRGAIGELQSGVLSSSVPTEVRVVGTELQVMPMS